MSSVLQQLIDMGFDKTKAEAAAKGTNNLEEAIEWIMAETSSSAEQAPVTVVDHAPNDTRTDIPVAQSYKCNDCNKLFKNEDEMMFHASKTKHENFSESDEQIKQLTPEEKAEKVLELRLKIKALQEKKAKQEAEENRQKEQIRREQGKAVHVRKEQFRDREILEAAEQRKREKIEDDQARRRVLEQIKADREARNKQPNVEEAPKPAAAPVVKAPPRDYNSTMIQFRLLNGQMVKQEFKSVEPLAMVRAWVETNHSGGEDFSLMSPFPRKVFTEDDMGTPLAQLDLVPSANIVLTRRQ